MISKPKIYATRDNEENLSFEATITDKTVETTESNVYLWDIRTLIAHFSSPFPSLNVALYVLGLLQQIFSKKQTATLRR